jgi:hypothetical protein
MPLPPAELLFEHLVTLRDAEDATHPRHDRRWREISAWLERAYPGRAEGVEDARQEALASLVRNVAGMRAEGPLQAAQWVMTIVRRKRVDAIRLSARDPVLTAMRAEPRGSDTRPLLERIAGEESEGDRAAHVARVVSTTLEHVRKALEDTVPSPAKRLMRATQAQAALLRLVCEEDAEAIGDALSHGEPVTRDRVYKWIERGRPVVLMGLERWQESLDEDEREEGMLVIAVLRELVEERRADIGLPRPERRKDRTEGGA